MRELVEGQINPFHATRGFLYVFWEYRKRQAAWNGLMEEVTSLLP